MARRHQSAEWRIVDSRLPPLLSRASSVLIHCQRLCMAHAWGRAAHCFACGMCLALLLSRGRGRHGLDADVGGVVVAVVNRLCTPQSAPRSSLNLCRHDY